MKGLPLENRLKNWIGDLRNEGMFALEEGEVRGN